MDHRETKDLKVQTHTFVVKTYATAREANAIQQAYFKGSKVEIVGDQPKISEFNPTVQFEVEQEMIAQIVCSMDGTTEDVVDRCVNLPNDEYRELIDALDELVSKKKT